MNTDLLAGAAVLGLVIIGLTSLAQALVFGTKVERIRAASVLVVALLAVVLVVHSQFAAAQIILGIKLSEANLATQGVFIVIIAGGASGGFEALKKLADIGTPVPKPPVAVDQLGPVQSAGAVPGGKTVTGAPVAK